MTDSRIDPRIAEYESRYGCRLLGALGPGVGQDGFVQRSDRGTAVKFFERADRFHREWEVYRVLGAKGIYSLAGHNVPELERADDHLLAIEMTIVNRPFLLDFAGARRPAEVPDFEAHVLEEYEERLKELFDERWQDALHVAAVFERETGFVLTDLHPGNIAFDAG